MLHYVAGQMGAELMSFTLLTDLPERESRYTPRHSSSRRAPTGSGRLAQAMRIVVPRSWAGRPEPPLSRDRFPALDLEVASHCPFRDVSALLGPSRCPCPCGRALPEMRCRR
jgi:hypothetical protein